MRRDVDAGRLRDFLRALGATARAETTLYLTGDATALLYGWRPGTIDVDLKLEPERDEVLRALPRLKEELEMNVELASPMLDRGLVAPARLRELHAAIEPLLYRFPSVDPPTFRASLEAALSGR